MIFNTHEDTVVTGVIPASIEGLSFLPEGQTRTENGVVHLNSNGSFTYEPDENFNGEDRFFYAATDADQRLIEFDKIILNVEPVNDAPIAPDAFVMTDEDVALAGFLSATDTDNETLRFSLALDENDHLGNLVVRHDGSFNYRPDPNANGVDQFMFNVSDGENISQATIQIEISPINDAPIFRPQSTRLEGVEDGPPIVTQLIANDAEGDVITYRLDPDPNFRIATPGSATLTPEGLLTYDPGPNRSGIGGIGVDLVAVIADDGKGGVTDFLISPNVERVIDPPIVEDFEITATRGRVFIGQVDAINVEGERLSYRVSDAIQAEAGDVIIDQTGRFTYSVNDQNLASDQFELIVSSLGADAQVLVDVMIEARPTNGGSGRDVFNGDDNANLFNALAGEDLLYGEGGADTLSGGAGSDTLSGDNDNDVLSGGLGDDVVSGGFGRDQIFGGAGADILRGGSGSDIIEAGGGRDRIFGGNQGDVLRGDAGQDVIEGGNGRDTIEGGNGRDQIIGGGGADILTGNAGADRFLFFGSDGRDRITDFQQGRDLLEIDAVIGFNQLRISQLGENVRIDFANTKIIVLDDQVENFSAADFIFQ